MNTASGTESSRGGGGGRGRGGRGSLRRGRGGGRPSRAHTPAGAPAAQPVHQAYPARIIKPVPPHVTNRNALAVAAAAAPNGLSDATITHQDVAHQASRTSSSTLADLVDANFSDLPLHPLLLRAVVDGMGYTKATKVQADSIPPAVKGTDLLVKAKTGTGKTLAFLMPALDRVVRLQPDAALTQSNSRKKTTVDIVVISPTRELARQIDDEAILLLKHAPALKTQVVFGGTNVRTDVARFRQSGMPTVLVATPGRLLDHLGNRESGLANAVKDLKTLILDEADTLLDMGFRVALEDILKYLPPVARRQTLLFSATMPRDVRTISKIALRPNYQTVDCIGEEASTHEQVPQHVLVTSIDDQIPALGCCLVSAMQAPDYKIIVFFTTARVTQLFAELFTSIGRPVLEMHSRKSQAHRSRLSDQFRNNNNLVMFSSDVVARGLDFPDVTCIIQVGLPSNREQYIHRLGRTARAGKSGSGVLLLSDFEYDFFISKISDLPVESLPLPPRDRMDLFAATARTACIALPTVTKAAAYQAWLGYYKGHLRNLRWNTSDLVSMANHWITSVIGEREQPALQASTLGKMGLRGVTGIRVGPRAR